MPSRSSNANANQRARRARRPRIDYYPSPTALAAIEAKRSHCYPTNNYGGILDSIIMEWWLAQNPEVADSRTNNAAWQANSSENRISNARSTLGGHLPIGPELVDTSRARAPARKTPDTQTATSARVGRDGSGVNQEAQRGLGEQRIICGARRRRDGNPCQSQSVPGKRRCKWHGGCSTGPRTAEGRERSMRNLRQFSAPVAPAA